MAATRFFDPLEWYAEDQTAIASSSAEALLARVCPIGGQKMHHHKFLLFDLFGKYSTTGSPTGIWRVRWGGLTGTLIGLSETLTLGTAAANFNWHLWGKVQARADGATGTVLCNFDLEVHTAAGTVLRNVGSISGFDAPAIVTVDLHNAADFAMTFQWGTADAANTITAMSGYVGLGN